MAHKPVSALMIFLQHREEAAVTKPQPRLMPLPVLSQELGNNMKESGDQGGEQTFWNGWGWTTTTSAEETPDVQMYPRKLCTCISALFPSATREALISLALNLKPVKIHHYLFLGQSFQGISSVLLVEKVHVLKNES